MKMWDQAHEAHRQGGGNGRTRQKRVVEKEQSSESKSWAIESERRLDLLHVEYEIRRLLPQTTHGNTILGVTENGYDVAERDFSNLAEIGIEETRSKRRNARPYLYLAKREYGLGLTLMLGVQTRKQWVPLHIFSIYRIFLSFM